MTQEWECFTCHKRGHTSVVCRYKSYARQWEPHNNNVLNEEINSASMSIDCMRLSYEITDNTQSQHHMSSDNTFPEVTHNIQVQNLPVQTHANGESHLFDKIFSKSTHTRPPLLIDFYINGVRLSGEVDTGACVSVIDNELYVQKFSHVKLLPVSDTSFSNADGNMCVVVGKINVVLNFRHDVQIVIIKSQKPIIPLIGRPWLDVLCPDWRNYFNNNVNCINELCVVSNNSYIENVFNVYADVFKSSNEPIIGVKVKLELKENFTPKSCEPAKIPFVLRDKVKSQVKEKQERNILKYVKESKSQSKQGERKSREEPELKKSNEQSVFRVGDVVYVWYPPAKDNYVEGKIVSNASSQSESTPRTCHQPEPSTSSSNDQPGDPYRLRGQGKDYRKFY